MRRRYLPDVLIVAGLLLLPLLYFAPVTLGGRTQIPADNLYQFEPWLSLRADAGVPEIPQNALLSDLLLENYQWKAFIRQSIDDGVIPLWQTEQFAGTPFLAAGQHSALYPFSLIYYVLPLPRAYGWFTVSQLWLAGTLMYLFARGLGLRRIGGVVAGVAYQFSAFFIVSVVFPMMIAGAAWLPLILLMIEFVIQRRPIGGRPAVAPWIAVGALAIMMNIFAGHVEITYYTLIVMAYYAAARLISGWWAVRRWRSLLHSAGSLLVMVLLGLGLGAVQFIPLYELGTRNFRESAASFSEVRGYAFPARHVAKFVVPNIYGSPAQHEYRDVFSWEMVAHDWQRPCAECPSEFERVTNTDFGMKNYVEGGAYLGILTLALAVIGLVSRRPHNVNPSLNPPPHAERDLSAAASRRASPFPVNGERGWEIGVNGGEAMPPYRLILAILALISLTFAFGLPTYALLYYAFPNLNQLHTPFRWVWPLTFCVAALAAFGADALDRARGEARVAKWISYALIGLGMTVLIGLLVSRIAYGTFEPLLDRVFDGLAKANLAFPDVQAFYSYEFWNVLLLGVFTLAAGIAIRMSRWSRRLGGIPVWQIVTVGVIALDLMIAGWGFNPSADPDWLDVTPESVRWLQAKQAEGLPFRYTTINFGENPLHANSTWRNGLQDARGYDSMIPRQYANYMSLIAPQGGLLHNRIDPIAWDNAAALASPLLDLLNVRYVVTDWQIENAETLGYREVYVDDAVKIYENQDVLHRAYMLPYIDLTEELCGATPDDFATIITNPAFGADPRRVVIEGFPDAHGCDVAYRWPEPQHEADPVAAPITHYGSIEVIVTPDVDQASWLVLADSYYPGWKAFVRPQGTDQDEEKEVDIHLVNGNFRGVTLEPGAWIVRFRYSPATFQIGAFLSFLSGMLLIFMLMLWLWRRVYRAESEADSAKRIAKNSLAPIILNLFNRGIDFAFAFIMLRMLGPANAGIYYYAIVVFGWFDILTNFGLNTLLMREVARDRASARRYLFNTTALRLALAVIGVPLLIGFLVIRQSTVDPALETQAILAIVLLYIGLLPNSLSTGLTALFYAFEKAEYPAAITTISTIVKVTLGLGTLLFGWGVVGLAGGAVVTNLVTLAVLGALARPLIQLPYQDHGARQALPLLDRALMRQMLSLSWPLMINHLLATVFFKIDIILMEAINGNTVVGQYSTAYKWLDALNIIPAFLTMALLPIMARQAHEDRAGLRRNYLLAVKLLVMVALPLAVVTTFTAEPLVRVLGGEEYLPAGGIALQLMIWSIPIGWINSVSNYVIVALDRQRTLTLAFAAGVLFNVIANLIFLPAYGYRAAAIITIFSEGVLFLAFYRIIRGEVETIHWGRMLWRPAAAALFLAGVILASATISPLMALLLSPVVYSATLIALRPFAADEIARVAPLLPGRLRRMLTG